MIGGGHLLGGNASAIKSIQANTITIANGSATNTAVITAVDVNNAFVIFLGASETTNNTANSSSCYAQLTNTTTVTAGRNTDASSKTGATIVSFMVVEFYPGFIKSIQTGLITLNGVVSNTAAITAVDITKSMILQGGSAGDTVGSDDIVGKMVLTTNILVTVSRGAGVGILLSPYTVVEFY